MERDKKRLDREKAERRKGRKKYRVWRQTENVKEIERGEAKRENEKKRRDAVER